MRNRLIESALVAFLFSTAFSAETLAQGYLKPGYVSPVDRQLSHTSDGNGRPLPGWHAQQLPYMRSGSPKEERERNEKMEARRREIKQRLETIRLPEVSFDKTPLRDVTEWLKQEIKSRSKPEDPEIRILVGNVGPNSVADQTISLTLSDVTVQQALDAISKSAELRILQTPSGPFLLRQRKAED